MLNKKFPMILILLLISAIYLPTISYPFVFDSEWYLLENPFVKSFPLFEMLRDIPAFVRTQSALVPDADFVVSFVLRPFSYLTFHLNFLAGGFDSASFRLVNIALHCVTSLLVYALLNRLLSLDNSDEISPKSTSTTALMAAALFAVNPMHHEAVIYTVQRFTSLASCLYLACIYAHLRAMTSTTTAKSGTWQGVSVVTLLLGLLSKEIVITAPIMMILLNWMVLRKTLVLSLRNVVPQLCCLPLVPLLIMQIKRGDQTVGIDLEDLINIVNYTDIPPFDYLMTQCRALLSYFRMLLIPYGQSIDHVYPRIVSWTDPELLVSLGVLGVFIVAAFRLARRRNDLSAHLTAFFIIWYFVSISVSSSFITLPDIFVERRAYLPSIGLFAGITLQAQHIMAGKFSSRRVIGICTAVILLYTTAAIFRARLWRSDITIWKDVIASYPTNSRALNNLGNEYLKQERYDEAIPYLRKSLQLTIDDITYQNLGSALINTGKFAEAHRLYMEGLLHFPNDYLLLTGMGVCSYNTEDLKGALRYLKKAIAINGGHDLAEQYYKLTIEKLQRPQL